MTKRIAASCSLWLLLSLLAQADSAADQNTITDIAAQARGKVGVACRLEGVEICAFHEHDHFPMQSVYKVPIAMAMLTAVDRGAFSLDQKIRFLPSDLISPDQGSPLRDAHPAGNVDVSLRELLRLAVSDSDGVASDILLRVMGGPAYVDAYVRRLGIEGIKIADTEKTLGLDVTAQYRNYAQPAAMVALLELLTNKPPLSATSLRLLMQWMTESKTGPQRLRGLLPPQTVMAHKTGTSGTHSIVNNVTNDVGIITLPDGRHLLIAVFVCDSRASQNVRELVIAKVAREAYSIALATKR